MGGAEKLEVGDEAMSPERFAPFDGLPLQAAVAWSETFTLLWCNTEFARQRGGEPEELRGRSFYSILSGPAVEERRSLLNRTVQDKQRVCYIQIWNGMRSLTRAWPLDPKAFGQKGCFVVTQPAPFSADALTETPLVLTPDLGVFRALTDRELEVLYLLAGGNSAKEVATLLHRSVRTIENHTGAIHSKLGISRRSELTRLVVEHGLLAFSAEQWASIIQRAA